jgi:hypothetical protein
MASDQLYKTKSFNLHGLEGISDKTIDLHLSLYEGYVKATNALQGRIAEFLRDEQVDQEEFPAYSELTRRLGFEFNGMVLHEYYFDNLTPQASLKPDSVSSPSRGVVRHLRPVENRLYQRGKDARSWLGRLLSGWCERAPQQSLGDAARTRKCCRFPPGPRHGRLGARVPARLFSRRTRTVHQCLFFQCELASP